MAVSQIAANIPDAIADLIQQNAIVRVFNDELFPRLIYRTEAVPELWVANVGERKVFTRAAKSQSQGIAPTITPGQDPSVLQVSFEQWTAEARQKGRTIPTHMPTDYVALASLFLRNVHELGLDAGQTLNHLARNAMYKAYCAGNTVLIATANAGATVIRVAALNGFAQKLAPTLGQPMLQPVSPTNALAISFPGTAEAAVPHTAIGALADNPLDPDGPGQITLGEVLANTLTITGAARPAVFASNRSRVTRIGGVVSIDGITAGAVITLQSIIDTISRMRGNNVPPCSDGMYHVHIDTDAEGQLFADAQFRQLFQSLPDSMSFQDLAIGRLLGGKFFRDTENPKDTNVGLLVDTSGGAANGLARYGTEIGAEVINQTGVPIHRCIIIGGGALYEEYLDESKYISIAGVTGKIGEFSVTNAGVQVMTERIRLIVRSPLDLLQQVVNATWSWSGDFAVPSDSLTGDTSVFKRAAVIEYAGSQV